MEGAELDPAQVRFRKRETEPGNPLGQIDVERDMELDREDGKSSLSAGSPESGSCARPEMVPAPDSPLLSVQLPTSRETLDIPQPLESSFDTKCAASQAPRADGAQYDELTRVHEKDQCSQRGYRKKESKAAWKTRLPTMDAAGAKRNMAEVARDGGKRERAPAKGARVSDNPTKPADFCGERRAGAREWGEGLGHSHSAIGFDLWAL